MREEKQMSPSLRSIQVYSNEILEINGLRALGLSPSLRSIQVYSNSRVTWGFQRVTCIGCLHPFDQFRSIPTFLWLFGWLALILVSIPSINSGLFQQFVRARDGAA